MTTIAETLTTAQVAQAQVQAQAIASSGSAVVGGNQFVFFAAFDGTDNDRNDVALSGNPQSTNVAQLATQIQTANEGNSSVGVGYYAGPGTAGSLTASSWLGPQVTQQVIDTANQAYDDFADQASKWLAANPGGSVTTMMTSFSRGGASAAIFSQLLYERGLVDPKTGQTLIPSGQVGVSAGLILDPVDTGVSGNLAFAPNVQNITVVQASNEYRYLFEGANYAGESGVTTLDLTGNHCDVGGGYDNGLGAISLQAGTLFFQNTGIPVASVPASRQFDTTQPVVVHSEAVDDYGHPVWSVYGSADTDSVRLTTNVATPGAVQTSADGTKTETFTDVSGNTSVITLGKDGGSSELIRYDNGTTSEITRDPTGAILSYRPALPVGVTVGSDQFYVDSVVNNLDTISSVTGVSVSTLMGLNSGLGITSGTQTISTGALVNLPPPNNSQSPVITVTPDPVAQTSTANEGAASQATSLGYTEQSATASVGFTNGTLNASSVVATTEAALADGGVRPGEVQADPNPPTNEALADLQLAADNPNATNINAATLGSEAANSNQQVYIDPLLMDLTGNGVGLTSFASNPVLFDVDHSGTVKRTGWADASTGILVVPDANGSVTNISQMFSQYYGGTAGSNGGVGSTPYANGFAALAAQDANHDGVINASDPIFSQMRVWVDANHDGVVGSGELKTLAQLGITQINLNYAATNQTQNGNTVTGTATFVMNGQSRAIDDVNLISDPTSNTLQTGASGTTVTSTATSSTGTKTTVTTYTDTTNQNVTLNAATLGVNNVYAGSGNDTLIAAAGGSWLVGGSGSDTFEGGAGNDVFVVSGNDNPANITGGGGTDMVVVTGTEGMTIDMAQEGVTIAEGGQGDDVIESGGRTGVYIKGGTGNDTLIGGAGNDVIVGGSGHNLIIGGTGQAVIYAGPNGDTIYGAAGDSIINAGGGADHIYAGAGNDVIKVGMGNAIIDGGGGTNIVEFDGSYADYRIVKGTNDGVAGYWVADTVPNRDGTVFISNVQKLNFADIQAVDLTLPNPMPVADTLTADESGKTFDHTQAHLIAASQLLANDQPLNSQGPLHITAVSDAVGGTVSLTQAGDVLFTPDATFTGIMSFKYTVADAAGDAAATIQDLNTGQTAPMRASVTLLTPNLPTDPLLSKEWYLTDSDILPVWTDYTGKGVSIGQFEPGGTFAVGPEVLDYNQPDLVPNIDPAWLASQEATGTLPTEFSDHATMVAGVMVAADNGSGAVGVAYNATVAGYYLANNGSDQSGLGHMASYDIANNSWNFQPDFAVSNITGGEVNTASELLANAQYAADNGRGGLGTIIVEAGGNARATGGSAQGSLTNNNRFSIEVGAINEQGDLSTLSPTQAAFSNPGASLLVSAPGSNITSTSELLVTDQDSIFGSDASTMQGTSFATPIVSGIVALMLQANPNLGYRDVQAILALSAHEIDDPTTTWSNNGATDWNGGGMHTSNDYGFGEVDARAAVRLAETWTSQNTGANEMVYSASSGALTSHTSAGGTVSSTLAMSGGLSVEHAEIDLNASFGALSDLVVRLVSPDGTQSVLLSANDPGDTQTSLDYTFTTTHDWGEQSAGSWTLQVADAVTGQPVTLNNWSLRLYGSQTNANDTYYYTDEYKTELAASASRGVLNDATNGTPGGINAINAAAVTGDTTINLLTGTASLGGASLTIQDPNDFSNLFSGDGNDTLTANANNAILDGGRGNNTLVGGSACDLFVVLQRENGQDTIVNFNAALGEVIDLVGFTGQSYANLTLTQQGSDVVVGLGSGQTILVKNTAVSALGAQQFAFQDTFVAPAAYVTGGSTATTVPSGTGVINLDGGGNGVSLTTVNGQFVWSLTGTIYRHDSASADDFVIAKQATTNYGNALQGFRHGVDKIDLSALGITNFSDLTISAQNRGTVNGVATIHGTEIISASLGNANILYLDALDPTQLSASDFIFASPTPGQAGTVNMPVTAPATNATTGPTVPLAGTIDPAVVGSNAGITSSQDANGVTTVSSSVDYALSTNTNRLTLTGSADIDGVANNNGDVITGNAGDDTLIGGTGNDTLIAGSGSDLMLGSAGQNTYIVNAGGGTDTIQTNAGQSDTLVLQGVAPGYVSFSAQGNDLLVTLNPGQANASQVVVTDQLSGQGVGAITMGSQTFSAATIAAIVQSGAVTASQSSLTQTESSAAAWSYALPTNLFASSVAGDVLTYSATLANGDPLPAGLTFDPVKQMLSGTAGIYAGDISINVTATDLAGATATSALTLLVTTPVGMPTLGTSLAQQTLAAGSAWNYALPNGLFNPGKAGDTLTYTAMQTNGAALPAWLSFDPIKQTFTGTPPDATAGPVAVTIVATETGGLSTSTTLNVQVNPTYQAPTVSQTLATQTVAAGSAWSYALPATLFNEASVGDALTYKATLASGNPLPAWVSFDPIEQVFSGTPTDQTTGALALKITAFDLGGLATSTTLNVQVNPTYQAPTVNQTLATQTVTAGSAWNYTLPTTLFSEAIGGDAVTYKATLANGDPLPGWLTFDPVKQVFSGTPTDQTTGAVALKITATDMGGLTTSSTLNVQVNPTYQAPTVNQTLATQTVAAGSVWSYALPATLFGEAIAGDTVTYTATLANGSALPSWLSFDPIKQTFSGTPTDQTTGALALKIIATDMGGLSASAPLSVQVNPTYQAPVAAQVLATQTIEAGSVWNYALPTTLFSEAVAADTLGYQATLANGAALPTWLTFDPVKQTFSGTPTDQTTGALAVKVTATDMGGLATSTTLNLQVNPAYQTPTVMQTLSSQSVTAGTAWSYSLPATLFSEAVAGDTLRYSATLADGTALPAWLSFDATKLVFSGTPPSGTSATVALKITATDMGGLSASAALSVVPVAPATTAGNTPVVSQPLSSPTIAAGTLWSYVVPAGLFSESAAGDTLTYEATLANGSPLPSWLTFDPVKLTFSGTPTDQTTGALQLRITATEQGGLSASAPLNVTVNPAYAAPTASQPLFLMTALGQPWQYALPTGLFYESVAGDTLTYTAKMADGTALPSWLSFDPIKQTFSGTPSGQVPSALNLKITATDMGGLSSSTTLTVQLQQSIFNVNTFQTVTAPVGQIAIQEANAFSTVTAGDENHVLVMSGSFDAATFGSGANWAALLSAQSKLTVGDGNNVVQATGAVDVLTFGKGNNTVTALGSQDVVNAGGGNNTIVANGSIDTITVGAGANTITANGAIDTISAGSGNNTITATGGSDTITVGGGENVITAGSSDTITVGDGANTIGVTGSSNKITAGAGNNIITASGGSDTITVGGGTNNITVGGPFETVTAGAGNNAINASGTFDSVTVGAGTNKITTTGTFSTLKLGDGTDTATMTNTFATATVGHGTYNLEFGAGFGTLKFGADTASDHLWFQHVGQDLQITAVGVGGTVTLKNWYASTPEQPSSIVAGDGTTLSNSSVNQLVQAMAAFAPPAAGATSFTADEQTALKPILVANWH